MSLVWSRAGVRQQKRDLVVVGVAASPVDIDAQAVFQARDGILPRVAGESFEGFVEAREALIDETPKEVFLVPEVEVDRPGGVADPGGEFPHGKAPVAVAYEDRAGSLPDLALDRKSTRLNSSHITISYAVFCLKK